MLGLCGVAGSTVENSSVLLCVLLLTEEAWVPKHRHQCVHQVACLVGMERELHTSSGLAEIPPSEICLYQSYVKRWGHKETTQKLFNRK